MIRTTSPVNSLLKGSTCLFFFEKTSVDDKELESSTQGEITRCKGDSKARVYRYSHAWGDAFAGLFHFYKHAKAGGLELNSNIGQVKKNYVFEDYVVESTIKKSKVAQSQQTFTQRFVTEIFKTTHEPDISMVVALEDVAKIAAPHENGNSFVIVNLKAEKLALILTKEKSQWKVFLENIAAAAIKKLSSPEIVVARKPCKFLVSALGNIARLPYTNVEFHPLNFTMVPTPIYPHSANLITWSYEGYWVLTVCAHSSFDTDVFSKIEKAWDLAHG